MDKRLLFRLCKASKLKWLEERDWNVEWCLEKCGTFQQNYWLGIRCLWAECIAFSITSFNNIITSGRDCSRFQLGCFFFPQQVHLANSDSKTEVISQAEETYGSVKQSNSRFRAWCWFYFLLNCCFLVSIRGQSNGQDRFCTISVSWRGEEMYLFSKMWHVSKPQIYFSSTDVLVFLCKVYSCVVEVELKCIHPCSCEVDIL